MDMTRFRNEVNFAVERLQHPYTKVLRASSKLVAPTDLASQDIFFAILRASGATLKGSVSHIWPSILIG